ncbi:glycosyltransferase family 2 protein [Facklamia sp. 7083-14-GEN3]|uniref:glycosyltransferase family 2 protein n=1 Tax=Facklamia sp. 7083-14-GEN3 TaxID=2973478 RepID=UPI00215C744A|nr:glycosyltransferase family 2 protein [Facklamia sp. 7083-14-GEN3]MCR8969763.1 glycosyltransferase family 2 protein [Facklamia sp. 7083-14-GEN3]
MTVVVPCYNEEKTIQPFIEAILKVQKDLKEVEIELLLVDDGSTDRTLNVIKKLVQHYPDSIEYLSFSRNFGKEAGLYAGLKNAKGEYVAIMDVDLQDPPMMLVDMYRMIQDPNVDVVATRRTSREGEPAVRSFFASLFYKLNNLISRVELAEGTRDYRLMKAQVVDAVVSLSEYNRFSKGIFSWIGFKVKYLEYPNIKRVAGQSSWSFRSLFDYAIDGLISFSDLPLTIASYLGFFSIALALVWGIYMIIAGIFYQASISSMNLLALLILFMGGFQFMCMGIIGKYLGKIFTEDKRRPIYLVREEQLFED